MKPVAGGSPGVPHPLIPHRHSFRKVNPGPRGVRCALYITTHIQVHERRPSLAGMVVFACPLTPPYTHVHEHKVWMAAGAEHSRSHLAAVSRSSKPPHPLTFCYYFSFAQSLLLSTTLLTSKEAGSSTPGPSWTRPGTHGYTLHCRLAEQGPVHSSLLRTERQLAENAL